MGLILKLVKVSLYFLAGYAVSHYINEAIHAFCYDRGVPDEARIIASRFSAIGYLLPFAVTAPRHVFTKASVRMGSFQARVAFPLIWRGIEDPIWRALLIYVLAVGVGSSYFIVSFLGGADAGEVRNLVYYGLLFSIVNSVIEEVVWRGVIQRKNIEWLGKVYGLIVTSILFGLTHLDLGFPLGVCIAFAFGGFFMGGFAIRSQGIGPSILMHFYMNLIFVTSGMIFH